MAAFVIDASLLAALYVTEPLSQDAEAALARARAQGAVLHAPDLVLLEVANVLWKRTTRGELAGADAMTAISDVATTEIELHGAHRHAAQALALALAHNITAYDAAYVAVGIAVGGIVLSGDTTFCARAAAAGLPVTHVTSFLSDS